MNLLELRWRICGSADRRPTKNRRAWDKAGDTPAATPERAFTIIELLVVIAIILILAGLILSVSKYVQDKGARARAETEIAAMSAALESYKADNGIYPTDVTTTETLKANADPQGGNPANFVNASRFLYKKLSGDSDGNPTTSDPTNDTKNYLAFKPNMLSPNPAGPNTYIRDPFGRNPGNAYGYSTFKNVNPSDPNGNNPTFDLWSTCGETAKKSGETFQQYQQRWIKNW
jgi:prepilin-type N-terminal cleavage/methylation domain-containing protein